MTVEKELREKISSKHRVDALFGRYGFPPPPQRLLTELLGVVMDSLSSLEDRALEAERERDLAKASARHQRKRASAANVSRNRATQGVAYWKAMTIAQDALLARVEEVLGDLTEWWDGGGSEHPMLAVEALLADIRSASRDSSHPPSGVLEGEG